MNELGQGKEVAIFRKYQVENNLTERTQYSMYIQKPCRNLKEPGSANRQGKKKKDSQNPVQTRPRTILRRTPLKHLTPLLGWQPLAAQKAKCRHYCRPPQSKNSLSLHHQSQFNSPCIYVSTPMLNSTTRVEGCWESKTWAFCDFYHGSQAPPPTPIHMMVCSNHNKKVQFPDKSLCE